MDSLRRLASSPHVTSICFAGMGMSHPDAKKAGRLKYYGDATASSFKLRGYDQAGIRTLYVYCSTPEGKAEVIKQLG